MMFQILIHKKPKHLSLELPFVFCRIKHLENIHHINPIDWTDFLYGFSRLLNTNGVLVVGGWDNSDAIIKRDGGKARYTGRKTWTLNALVNYIEDLYHVLHNDVLEVLAPSFAIKRIIRFYILEKND